MRHRKKAQNFILQRLIGSYHLKNTKDHCPRSRGTVRHPSAEILLERQYLRLDQNLSDFSKLGVLVRAT